jgi:hypothetical protein
VGYLTDIFITEWVIVGNAVRVDKKRRTADSRGRVVLGPEWSDKDLEVLVINRNGTDSVVCITQTE